MPSRAFRIFKPQIGKETTFGTAAAANKLLGGMSISVGPESEGELILPNGYRFPTGYALAQQWVAGEASGFGTYDEIIHVLSGCLGAVTPTTPGGGTNSRQWQWDVSPTAIITPQSHTVEWGDGAASLNYQMAGCVFNQLEIGVEGKKTQFGSGFIGRQWTRGATMTGSPTPVPRIPILGRNWSGYADDTWAGLGSSQMLSLYKGGLKIGERWGPDFTVNAALPSYKDVVESEDQSWEYDMLMGLDATTNALETRFEAGQFKYLRLENIGPIIEAAIPYKLTIDQAVLITKVGKPVSQNGVAAIPFTYTAAADSADKALKITVVNTQTAL